jgi:HK97 family phage portal protein
MKELSSNPLQNGIFEYVRNIAIPLNEPIYKYVDLFNTNALVYTAVDFLAMKASQAKPMIFKTKDRGAEKEMRKMAGMWKDSYEYKQYKDAKTKGIDEIYLEDIGLGDGDELLRLKRILTRPNDFQTFGEMLHSLVVFNQTVGWSMIYANTTNKGIIDLNSAPTHEIDIEGGSPKNPILSYKFKGNYQIKLDPKFCFPVRTFSTKYDRMGTHLYGNSKVKIAYSEILTYIEAVAREYTAFKTGDSAHILSPKDPEAQQSAAGDKGFFQKIMNDIFSGLRKKDRHQAVFVPYALEHINLASSLKDANVIESKKAIKEIVAGVFHLPVRVVYNDTSGGTYNNLKEDKKDALRNGVFPLLNQFEETINERIIKPNFGYEFGFDYDSYEELNPDVIADMERLAKVDFMSDNEKRSWNNLEELEDERANTPQKYWESNIEPMNFDENL